MRKGTTKYYIIYIPVLLVCFMLPGIWQGDQYRGFTGSAESVNSFERMYVSARTRGDVEAELEILRQWIPRIKDRLVMELALWRIYECTRHYGLIDSCLEELRRAAEDNEMIRNSILLSSRTMHLRKRLLMLSGRPDNAAYIRDSMGTIIKYTFSKTGKNSWVSLKADPSGLVNMGSLHGKRDNVSFFLRSSVYAEKEKKVYLGTGSTGRVNIHVNGMRVLNDKYNHGYCEDQHMIPVTLNKGTNSIVIRISSVTADSRFSMRLITAVSEMRSEYKKYGVPLWHIAEKSGLHPVIGTADGQKKKPVDSFYAGYFLYRYGFRNTGEMDSLLRYSARNGIAPALCHFYRGDGANEEIQRFQAIYEAFRKGMPEALLDFIMNASVYGLGQPAIDSVKKLNYPGKTSYAIMARALQYSAAGLEYAAIRELQLVEEETIYNDVHYLRGQIYADMNKNQWSSESFMKFIRRGGFKPRYILDCVAAQKKAGMYREAESLLLRGVRCYPHSMDMYMELSMLYLDSGRATMALATILAARNKAPWNEDVRHRLGLTLGMMGHDKIAEKYLRD